MRIGKILIWVVALVVIIWTFSTIFKKDTYTGFYYPNANNLTKDIQSSNTFESIEACRAWANEQASIRNPNGSGYDYECGKNCNLSGGKPYVCEKTLK